MNLPGNGSVVIIDDRVEEALPLLKVLSKHQVPVTYFMGGEPDELPEQPISNIRLLFLDLNLVDSTNIKTIRSALIKNLERIVSKENGPYIMILWSVNDFKYKDLVSELFENELQNIKPIISLNLQKADYFETDEKSNLNPLPNFLVMIEEKLKEEMQRFGIFHIFILWENIVHESAKQTIKEFSTFYDPDENWNKKLSDIVFHLATAYAGKQLESNNKKDIIQNGLLTFNGAFLDTLENNVRSVGAIDVNIDFDQPEEVLENIRAKINSKLHLIGAQDMKSIQPGNVYEISGKSNFIFDVKELFNEFDDYDGKQDFLKKIRYILLEISPSCDFAQNKWKLSRLLPGVMWPSDHFSRKSKKKNKEIVLIKKADYIYASPVFEIDNLTFKLVFDFRYLTALSFEELDKLNKPDSLEKSKVLHHSFCLRHQLLVDIQSHLARHINRPGVTFIEEERKNKKKN